MKKLLIGGALVAVSVAAVAGPAFAHDCFNPRKTTGAGSGATIVLDAQGNEVSVTQTKNGKGGFVSIDATALGVGIVDVHVPGAGNKDGEVGPGADKAGAKACDGKGIDYVDACFGPG